MNWIAWRMLIADPVKYFGIVAGVSFAALLISQQSSIFCGLISLTASPIRDIGSADIWVMDPAVEYIDAIEPMVDNAVQRVRGVEGVEWAVPLYKGLSRARLDNGEFEQVSLFGLDDTSLLGAPADIALGQIENLKRPDAVIIDERGYRRLFPGEEFSLGRQFEINDQRAVVVGICRVSKTFQTFPVIYCRYSQALRFQPPQRKSLSFVLATAKAGMDPEKLAASIENQTRLKARTSTQFQWDTIGYYMRETGIPINFGITVLLGFIVGTAIAGQTFYLFTVENIRQFAMLKAIGVSGLRLLSMVLFQALLVGMLGYGIGLGGAAAFGMVTGQSEQLAFFMPWQIAAITATAVLLIVILSSLICIVRVVRLNPAEVFRS